MPNRLRFFVGERRLFPVGILIRQVIVIGVECGD